MTSEDRRAEHTRRRLSDHGVSLGCTSISQKLVQQVVAGANMPNSRWHGLRHWLDVAANGMWLAALGAECDLEVVLLFALFHDTMRENDDSDPHHGPRSASYALTELGHRLPVDRLDTLVYAIADHASGRVSDDPTVGVCWDADRLDLPRVGVIPDPSYLSTEQARGVLAGLTLDR